MTILALLAAFLSLPPAIPPARAAGAPEAGTPSVENTPGAEDPSGCLDYDAVVHLRNGGRLRLHEYCRPVALSPDKRYAAFRTHNGESGLFLAETEKGKIERRVLLLKKGDPDIHAFVWSPDGRYVAFIVCNKDLYPRGARLFIDDTRGDAHRTADVGPQPDAGAGCGVYNPVWAPNGSRLATVETGRDGKYRLTLLRPDGEKTGYFPLPWWPQEVRWDEGGRITARGIPELRWDERGRKTSPDTEDLTFAPEKAREAPGDRAR